MDGFIENQAWLAAGETEPEIIERYDIGHCLIDYKLSTPRLPGDDMVLVWWDDQSLLFVSRDQAAARGFPACAARYPVIEPGEWMRAVDPAVAEADLRRAVIEAPRAVLPKLLLASALGRAGNWREAETLLEGAIALAPWRGDLRLGRGRALAGLGRRDDAIAELRRGLAREPGDASGWAGLGRLLSDAGDQRGAARALEKAVRLAPRNPAFALDLGHVYERSGEKARAEGIYRSVLEDFPGNREAEGRLRRLISGGGG